MITICAKLMLPVIIDININLSPTLCGQTCAVASDCSSICFVLKFANCEMCKHKLNQKIKYK